MFFLSAKYGHPFTFHPQGTLWFVGNDPPLMDYDDDAAWNRVHVIPFLEAIPKDEQDEELLSRIDPEAVLAWAVRGLSGYYKLGGLKPPRASRAARREQREESNPIADFVDQRCVLGEGHTISVADLYHVYVDWSRARWSSPILAGNS